MRLIMKMTPVNGTATLPLHYNYYIQAMIYEQLMDERFRTFLHERGYGDEQRPFRLFTFSSLVGPFRRREHDIQFMGEVSLTISSPVAQIVEQLGQRLMEQQEIRIAGAYFRIEQLEVRLAPPLRETVTIEMLTPMTIYETQVVDGKKRTHYFTPLDEQFAERIALNAKRKYEAFYGVPYDGDIQLRWVNLQQRDRKVLKYKQTIIIGWKGQYELRASSNMLQFLYDVGLGGKNSQGFGMFKVQS